LEKERLLKEIEVLNNQVLFNFYKCMELATEKPNAFKIESLTRSFNMYSKIHDKILRGYKDDKSV
jgi:hypothetical protein